MSRNKIRALIALIEGEDGLPWPTTLARQAGGRQPRGSQVLTALSRLDLVERVGQGRCRPDRSALLDRFLDEYPGPGGAESYLYSLDEPLRVAVEMARRSTPGSLAVSADVGPDLVAPWRRPSIAIVYAFGGLPRVLGLVKAEGAADANVIVREPRDRSVFPTTALVAEADNVEIPLADPAQMIWDLQNLGGADRLEAAEEVRRWLLERH